MAEDRRDFPLSTTLVGNVRGVTVIGCWPFPSCFPCPGYAIKCQAPLAPFWRSASRHRFDVSMWLDPLHSLSAIFVGSETCSRWSPFQAQLDRAPKPLSKCRVGQAVDRMSPNNNNSLSQLFSPTWRRISSFGSSLVFLGLQLAQVKQDHDTNLYIHMSRHSIAGLPV